MQHSRHPIRIGARASRLSQVQARQIQAAITALCGADPSQADQVAPIVLITTTGDRVQDRRLLEIGGKALFTKEIEEALIEGRIDCAVHCVKDMPTLQPDGLVIAAIPEREDPRDALILPEAADGSVTRIEELPQGARLGTASLRRQAQAHHIRPDLSLQLLRGNVDTRLGRLEEGYADAILLAYAGMRRLGLAHRVAGLIDPSSATPAPGQGALAIQTRAEDALRPEFLGLHHPSTAVLVAAERGALEALEGSCKTAVGAYAHWRGADLALAVEALTPDGARRWCRNGVITTPGPDHAADCAAAFALGVELGAAVRRDGGEALVLNV